MTALVKEPGVQESKQTGVNGGSVGENMYKITVGAAALAAKAIYEIMQMYAEIMKLMQDEKVAMVKAQESEGRGQADATEKAGKVMMWSLIAAGAITALCAGLGAAITTVGMKSEKWGAGTASKKASAAEKEFAPMKELDAVISNSSKGSKTVGDHVDKSKIEERVTEFKNGMYSNAKNDDVTREAYQRVAAEKGETWIKAFKKAFASKQKELNLYSTQINTQMTEVNTAAGIIKELGGTGGSVANGIGQGKKAAQDAIASLDGNANQMAGSAANDFGTAASKAFDAQNSEVRVLAEMNQANGMNA